VRQPTAHRIPHNRITSINLQSNSAEHSHSSEADSSSASQAIPHILQNPQIHCRLHNNPLLVPTLRQIYPFQTLPHYSLKINFNILPSTPRFYKWSLSFRCPLTPWCRVLLEKLTGLQLVKKFPAFHGTRRFITGLTSVRHLSLSWASPIQSIYLYLTFWRSIIILSTHQRLVFPSGLFPSGFPTKTLYNPLSSPIRATCPAHLILLDFITRTILGEEYKSFSSTQQHTPQKGQSI